MSPRLTLIVPAIFSSIVATIAANEPVPTRSTALLAPTSETDWPFWRGPNRNGIAADGQTPVAEWSDSKNVVWKSEVPGRGHSSPTIVGDRIFLATADERKQVQSVLCYERSTGKPLWKTDINQGGFPRQIHQKNTHATGTVACNGDSLFIAFYNNGGIQAAALDLDGRKLWSRKIGTFAPNQYKYGYAPSPALYNNLVIIAADFDGAGYLAGLDQKTGRTVWKQKRPAKLSFSSPIVANVAGKDQLLISGCEAVAGYDPASGRPLWGVPATTMATCGTMVWDGDLVFASGGYPKPETVCIRGDGSGKIVWKNSQKCYEQSMLAVDGYVYGISDQGVAFCWRGTDGREMWKSRLQGPVSASPILAGGNIYLSNERGTTFVFKADPNSFQAVARNQLGNEAFATPTIVDGKIYLRVATGSRGSRQEFLYCIGSSRS